MLAPSHSPSVPVRILIALCAALVLLAVLAGVALVVLNRTVVPSAVRSVATRVSAVCPCDLTVVDARYRPFRGIVIDGLRLEIASPAAHASADRVTVATGPAQLLRLRAAGAPAGGRASRGSAATRAGTSPASRSAAAVWSIARTLADRRAVPATVVVTGAEATLADPGLPPLRVRWERIDVVHDRPEGRFHLEAGDGDAAGLRAVLAYRDESVSASVTLREYALADLGIGEPGTVTGTLRADLAAELRPTGELDVSGLLSGDAITVAVPAIASERIGPIEISYEFAGRVDPNHRARARGETDGGFPAPVAARGLASIRRGDLRVNGLRMDVRPSLHGLSVSPDPIGTIVPVTPQPDPRALGVRVRLPATSVAAIHAALPDAIVGDLRTLALDGSLFWELDLLVPLRAIGEMEWTAVSRLSDFAVLRIGSGVNPYELNGSFVHYIGDERVGYRRAVRIPAARPPSLAWMLEHSEHTARQIARWRADDAAIRAQVARRPPDVVESAGASRRLRVDPAYTYVRLEEMSPWVVRAVLTAEDGDFFFHDGVNFYTLPRALARNIEAGEIQFGASTISMQVVKMLYLDQQRQVARKLQEVFLVYLMEEIVPVAKSRILEIYLNIAEFGPGVFGVADAARYYFDKTPADLDAGEATWLASILPSPKRYHRYYEAGAISPGWFERMKSYFDIMLERGRMTPEEYASAVRSPPRFSLR